MGAAVALAAAVVAALADLGAYFWIAVGSALGGMARYWLSGVAARLVGETFPWGTLLINVIGSFVIGFFGTLTGPDGRFFVASTGRQFVMVGICGGFTTFSSFSLQSLNYSMTVNGSVLEDTWRLRSCFASSRSGQAMFSPPA